MSDNNTNDEPQDNELNDQTNEQANETNDEQLLEDFINLIMDPNVSEQDLEDAFDDIEKQEAEAGLPPEEKRPQNEAEACLLLDKKLAETTLKELTYLLEKYHTSLQVAQLVARHPSLTLQWLARFTHYLPEDAQANPMYPTHSSDETWETNIKSTLPSSAQSNYYWTNTDSASGYICDKKPLAYKVQYWLAHGKAADKRYVVGLKNVDEATIKPLAKDKSAHVRKAIAARDGISLELAQIISQDKAKTVRQALALNSSCPPEVLTTLTQDKESIVSKAATENSNCPSDAIHAAKLADNLKSKQQKKPVKELNHTEIITLLADDNTDLSALTTLSKHTEDFVRAGVALHRNADAKLLAKLVKDASSMVKTSVTFNPNTTPATLQKILDSKDKSHHEALASNPSLTEEQQLSLIPLASEQVLTTLANNTESLAVWQALRDSEPPKSTTKKKSKTKSWRECIDICLNPSGKGMYAIQRSAKTRHLFVNKLVARHPKCPKSLISHYAFYLFESLAKNPDVAMTLLENPNAIQAEEYAEWKVNSWMMYEEAPGHVVRHYLRSDNLKFARKSIITWTAQIIDIQSCIYADDIHMKKYMAGLKNGTQFMFEVLARDSKETVRTAVAENPSCPAQVLAHLHSDKVASIRTRAQSHKNFNPKLVNQNAKTMVIESLKNKGPKRNRIKHAKTTDSVDVLKDLAGDKLVEVRMEVVRNRNTPLEVLEMLKTDSDFTIRGYTAYHDNTSLALCQSLFSDESEKVRGQALRTYIHQTKESLETLDPEDEDYNYSNNRYDEDTLAGFYNDKSEQVKAFVARLTQNIEIQKAYAQSHQQKVQIALAQNYRLDEDVAATLIATKDKKILTSLVENTPNLTTFLALLPHDHATAGSLWRNHPMMKNLKAQQSMMAHSNHKIRKVVADYATDDTLLMQCVNDPNDEVRSRVAYNEHLTDDHLTQLLSKASEKTMSNIYEHDKHIRKNINTYVNHENSNVRAYIAAMDKLPKQYIEQLVADKDPKVRFNLIENYAVEFTEEQLALLSKDPDSKVVQALKWR